MALPIKNQAVNWIDGMKLSSIHFKENDEHFYELLRDIATVTLTRNNFGLLMPIRNATESTEKILKFNYSEKRVEVQLLAINAITAEGIRIQVIPGTMDLISVHISASELKASGDQTLYVVVTCNPSMRIAIGKPHPSESPFRHPFTTPEIKLSIVQSGQFNANEAVREDLLLGKISWKGGSFLEMEDFVPPSRFIGAHPTLIQLFDDFDSAFTGLRKNSIIIVQKIFKEKAESSLAKHTGTVCSQILRFLSQINFSFRNEGHSLNPTMLAQYASILAGQIYFALILIREKEKEELIQYYSEWGNLRSGKLEETLLEIIDLRYDHADMMKSLGKAHIFLNLIGKLWQTLAQLKFIGQRTDNIVMVEEARTETKRGSEYSVFD